MAELREVTQQLSFRAAPGQGAEHIADGQPGSTHTRLTKTNRRIDRDASLNLHEPKIGPISRYGTRPWLHSEPAGQAAERQAQAQRLGVWAVPGGITRPRLQDPEVHAGIGHNSTALAGGGPRFQGWAAQANALTATGQTAEGLLNLANR